MNVDVARDRPASAFVLAQLEIRDPSTYERYARAVPATHVPTAVPSWWPIPPRRSWRGLGPTTES